MTCLAIDLENFSNVCKTAGEILKVMAYCSELQILKLDVCGSLALSNPVTYAFAIWNISFFRLVANAYGTSI